MHGRVMHLVMLVCVYVAKKSTCLVPYHLKKHCWVHCTTCFCNLNASEVVFYVQQVVQMEQFMLVLFRTALESCIIVFHASLLCIMQQLSEDLPWLCAVQLLLHVQHSSTMRSVHTGYVFCGTLIIMCTSYRVVSHDIIFHAYSSHVGVLQCTVLNG